MESVGDAIVVTDEQSLIRFWNPAAERLFGYTAEEAVGSPLTMLMPERFREAHVAGLARVLAGGAPRLIGRVTRVAGLRKDGVEFPLELSLARWSDEEGRELFTGVIHDVTQRERSERYLAAQLAVTEILMESTSIEDAMPRLVAAFAETMGWQLGALWTVDTPLDALRCQIVWSAADMDGSAFEARSRELTLHRGEGLPGLVWEAGRPLHMTQFADDSRFFRSEVVAALGLHGAIALPVIARGEVIGVVEFFTHDATEVDDDLLGMMETLSRQIGLFFLRKRTELAFERSNADLEHFAYVASHDLTEPLRTVGGFADLLARRYAGRLDGDADEFLTHITGGVVRMRALIESMLAYSRAGTSDLVPEEVDTAALVERTVSTLRPLVAEHRARVSVADLPRVTGDATQLAQLFQNLISNALKFRGEAPPVVDVAAQRDEGTWCFSVTDNGIGIPSDARAQVFEMFKRLHGRETYAGTGIGLAVCQRIVERHGGRIWVEEAPSGGSRFCFTIPEAGPRPGMLAS
jgi:PAS domain S-box-containing protein